VVVADLQDVGVADLQDVVVADLPRVVVADLQRVGVVDLQDVGVVDLQGVAVLHKEVVTEVVVEVIPSEVGVITAAGAMEAAETATIKAATMKAEMEAMEADTIEMMAATTTVEATDQGVVAVARATLAEEDMEVGHHKVVWMNTRTLLAKLDMEAQATEIKKLRSPIHMDQVNRIQVRMVEAMGINPTKNPKKIMAATLKVKISLRISNKTPHKRQINLITNHHRKITEIVHKATASSPTSLSKGNILDIIRNRISPVMDSRNPPMDSRTRATTISQIQTRTPTSRTCNSSNNKATAIKLVVTLKTMHTINSSQHSSSGSRLK